jgi:hypothetical protein
MGDSNGNGDGDGVDGDGSRGNSSSRQGAGIETVVPRNWSSMAVALRNFLWMDADFLRVFASEALYRRRGDTSQTYLSFLMLHACLYTICFVFCLHFEAFLCIFWN